MELFSDDDITELLRSSKHGDGAATDRLWRRVYDDLRSLARQRFSGRANPVEVEPTALVHDAWVRLSGRSEVTFESRTAFFCAAASAMRNALVDEARRASRLKRGGDRKREALEDIAHSKTQEAPELARLGDALTSLEEVHPRVGKLVELRYFAGLTMEQAAQALEISLSTAERDWRFGRTWLRRELNRGDEENETK